MASDKNWSTFTKRIPIRASTEELYRAWATQFGIESWFLRESVFKSESGSIRDPDEFVQSGDTYSWFWHGWSDEVNQLGKIISANGTDRLQFSFHDPMVVTLSIIEEEGERIVELTQEYIPKDDDARLNYFVGCGEGWTFYLANLKSVLEGGHDLRNRNAKIKKVINS